MRIAFATPLAPRASTIIGRVTPLATEFAKRHEVYVLTLASPSGPRPSLKREGIGVGFVSVGREPFTRTESGKKRLRGISLILNMLGTSVGTAWKLWQLKPDVVVIVKPIPSNVLGVQLYSLFSRPKKIILDVDDFELTANKLSSIWQRAAIHWSERTGAKLARVIITASPFLSDHFTQLTSESKKVAMIPTGLDFPSLRRRGGSAQGGDGVVLGYFGSVSISSGHRVDLLPDILQEVRRTIPNATLFMAGDGDDVTELKEKFAAKGLSDAVTWQGRFTLSEVEGLLQNVTVMIDPVDSSIANRAKSSFRIALATSAGLPVVSSNIGVRPHLLPQSFHERFFATPENAKSYAEKIVSALQNPLSTEQRTQLPQHAKQFTWPELAKQFEAVTQEK